VIEPVFAHATRWAAGEAGADRGAGTVGGDRGGERLVVLGFILSVLEAQVFWSGEAAIQVCSKRISTLS
jgi:hypothetical protein